MSEFGTFVEDSVRSTFEESGSVTRSSSLHNGTHTFSLGGEIEGDYGLILFLHLLLVFESFGSTVDFFSEHKKGGFSWFTNSLPFAFDKVASSSVVVGAT